MCADVFDVPMVLVSLVDKDRQWFKSKIGIDGISETSRRESFCAWTLLPRTPKVLVVRDAASDPRFENHPLVVGPPHIRSYVGAPLIVDGAVFGTLCLIDFEPRTDPSDHRYASETYVKRLVAVARTVSGELAKPRYDAWMRAAVQSIKEGVVLFDVETVDEDDDEEDDDYDDEGEGEEENLEGAEGGAAGGDDAAEAPDDPMAVDAAPGGGDGDRRRRRPSGYARRRASNKARPTKTIERAVFVNDVLARAFGPEAESDPEATLLGRGVVSLFPGPPETTAALTRASAELRRGAESRRNRRNDGGDKAAAAGDKAAVDRRKWSSRSSGTETTENDGSDYENGGGEKGEKGGKGDDRSNANANAAVEAAAMDAAMDAAAGACGDGRFVRVNSFTSRHQRPPPPGGASGGGGGGGADTPTSGGGGGFGDQPRRGSGESDGGGHGGPAGRRSVGSVPGGTPETTVHRHAFARTWSQSSVLSGDGGGPASRDPSLDDPPAFGVGGAKARAGGERRRGVGGTALGGNTALGDTALGGTSETDGNNSAGGPLESETRRTLVPAPDLRLELDVDMYEGRRRVVFEFSHLPVGAVGRSVVLLTARDVTRDRESRRLLHAAKRRSDAAVAAKTAFLANTSHEIRTPLNAIIAGSELIAELPGLSEDHAEINDMVVRASKTLLSIVNDVLDFSKIEADKVTLERRPFLLETCVDLSFEMQSIKANAKRLVLNYSVDDGVPWRLVGDEMRLRQIVTNLVGNAVKFTPEGGTVELRVRALGPEENELDALRNPPMNALFMDPIQEQKQTTTGFEDALLEPPPGSNDDSTTNPPGSNDETTRRRGAAPKRSRSSGELTLDRRGGASRHRPRRGSREEDGGRGRRWRSSGRRTRGSSGSSPRTKRTSRRDRRRTKTPS